MKVREIQTLSPGAASPPDCSKSLYDINRRTLRYDATGQLAHTTSYVGNQTVHEGYVYLGGAMPSFRTIVAQTGTQTQTTTLKYLYLEGRRIAVIRNIKRADNTTLRDYNYLHGDQFGDPVKVTRAAALGATGSGATSVWTQDRDAWGQPRLAAGSDTTLAEDVVFPGQVKLDDTAVTANVLVGGACVQKVIRPALAYNWHRFYDPMTGTYLEPDPIRASISRAAPQNMLLYEYANGSPVQKVDLTGLCGDCNLSYLDCLGDCVDKWKLDNLVFPLLSALPKKLLGFRVPYGTQPTTTLLSAGQHHTGLPLREAGRATSPVATAATLFEGFYDWGAIVRCGVLCQGDHCQGKND